MATKSTIALTTIMTGMEIPVVITVTVIGIMTGIPRDIIAATTNIDDMTTMTVFITEATGIVISTLDITEVMIMAITDISIVITMMSISG